MTDDYPKRYTTDYCPAVTPDHVCNREAGHAGPHIAATRDLRFSIAAVWEDPE